MTSAASRIALLLTIGLLSGPIVSAQSPSLVASPTSGASIGGPSSGQVTSDDGRLTLDIPVGALPDDVHLSAGRVPILVPAVAAYELRPAGTTFSAPVTVSWHLDPAGFPPATAGNLVWLGMARTDDVVGGTWAWLDDPHVTVVDGSYTVTGQLGRSGTLIVTQLPALVRGPEAMWGMGYAPGRGIPVDMDLVLVTGAGTPATATFSGDWRFGGGYPERISVTPSAAEADQLAAVWQCQRTGDTSLATTFGVREGAEPGSVVRPPGLGPAAAAFSVTFPVACGTVHPDPDPDT